ncbi:MAG: radical SAM protein [Hungatella sp.]|nr:radical SAM protein [Hungatella sp.]
MVKTKNLSLNIDYIITYELCDAVIIFNAANARWCKIDFSEYEQFQKLLTGCRVQDAELDENLVLKLLVKGIIDFTTKPEIRFSNEAPLDMPHQVYYEPTSYCNLNCVYCYANAILPENLEFDTEKSKEILDKIIELPTLRGVTFTGGEPLLRKDTLDLAQYVFDNSEAKLSILTNGLLINKDNVSRFKIFNNVTLSLDAHNEQLNSLTRGKGTFTKVVDAIKLLKKEGIKVNVTTVVSKTNIDYVIQIMDYMKELGVDEHNMSTHISMGRGSDNCIECSTKDVILYRKKYFDHLCDKKEPKDIDQLIRPRLVQGQIRKSCGASAGESFITDDGNVYPCRLFANDQYLIGNVLDSSLFNILHGENATRFIKNLNSQSYTSCPKCKYLYVCAGSCRSAHAAYTGDLKKSDDGLCTILKNEIDCGIITESGYNPITKRPIGEMV